MRENLRHFVPGRDIEALPPRALRMPAGRAKRLRDALEMSLMANAVAIAALLAVGALLLAFARDNVALHLQVARLHDQLSLRR